MTKPKGTETDGKLTFLVMRDNFASRTFLISQRWFVFLGFSLGIFAFLCVVSFLFAGKYYWIMRHTDASAVHSLNQQVDRLKEENNKLQQSAHQNSPTSQTLTPSTTQSITELSSANLFAAFPEEIQKAAPFPAGSAPIRITPIEVKWPDNKLQVNFNIEYTSQEGGNQQGRIFILARGPGMLLAFPPETLLGTGKNLLFTPLDGEFFSVSRFRATQAIFSQIVQKNAISDVDIFLFNPEGRLLISQHATTLSTPRPIPATTPTQTHKPISTPRSTPTPVATPPAHPISTAIPTPLPAANPNPNPSPKTP